MKVRLILIVFSLISISALTLSARTTSGADNLETAAIAARASGMESREVTSVLGVPSGVPRGPSELLHDYEAEMSAITQRFGDEVAAIANAVHSGQLTSDQGQQITAEQYQLAQMQFEVLSAWHDMLAQDLSRTNQGTEDREGHRAEAESANGATGTRPSNERSRTHSDTAKKHQTAAGGAPREDSSAAR